MEVRYVKINVIVSVEISEILSDDFERKNKKILNEKIRIILSVKKNTRNQA